MKPIRNIFETYKVYISEVAELCLTFCDPMDCSLPGFSVHGILPARVLEWVTIAFSRGSSQPGNWTQVSHIAGGFFTIWATREAEKCKSKYSKASLHTSQNDHHQKNLQTINAGEDMETRQPSHTVGGNLIDTATMKNSMEIP